MHSLKPYNDTSKGVADLLDWAALMDDGIVQGKSGALLAGWFYRGQDIASSTPDERNYITQRINATLARLGGGWSTWHDAVRMPAASYPAAAAAHFPDKVSELIDNERRTQFLREGAHFESEYAFIIQYIPPLKRESRVVDLIYDDDSQERQSRVGRWPISSASSGISRMRSVMSCACAGCKATP